MCNNKDHNHDGNHAHQDLSGHSHANEGCCCGNHDDHGTEHQHDSEHEHEHTHTHSHPHDHNVVEHEHSHGDEVHSHTHCGLCENDEEKNIEILTLLLDHWASHNKEHAMEYNLWVEKMNKMGKHDVAEEIIEAIALMNEADKHLLQAKKNI